MFKNLFNSDSFFRIDFKHLSHKVDKSFLSEIFELVKVFHGVRNFVVFPEFSWLLGVKVPEIGVLGPSVVLAEKWGSKEKGLEEGNSEGENVGFFFIEFFGGFLSN